MEFGSRLSKWQRSLCIWCPNGVRGARPWSRPSSPFSAWPYPSLYSDPCATELDLPDLLLVHPRPWPTPPSGSHLGVCRGNWLRQTKPGPALGGEKGDEVQGGRERDGGGQRSYFRTPSAGQGVEDRIHKASPGEVMLLRAPGHNMTPLGLCGLQIQGHLKYFCRIWAFFLILPKNRPWILELLLYRSWEKQVHGLLAGVRRVGVGVFGGTLVMKCSRHSFSSKVRDRIPFSVTSLNNFLNLPEPHLLLCTVLE